MGLLSKIISIPPIGRIALKSLKKRAFKPYQIPIEEAIEKQYGMLDTKFKKMQKTDIGRKLGISKRVKLQNLPITEYSFYQPFYVNPSPSAFMYPLEEYMKVKTSGTAGKEKWFLLPQEKILKAFKETVIPFIFAGFHDGKKITLEYGDNVYINFGPAPFISGILVIMGSTRMKPPFNFVPDINLPYKDKVQYFILNHNEIDAAMIPVSTLVSQIMPAIKTPIKLKGLLVPDTPALGTYLDEIQEFTGVTPRTAYGSVETGPCSLPSVQHSMGFIFDLRRGVFEFIPIKDKEAKKEKTVAINEVNAGETYKILFTDFYSEITRYEIEDSFLCIAKGDEILGIEFPVFKLLGRLEKTISLLNFTRISEEELVSAFKAAEVPIIDFTTKVESEKGMEYMRIFVEHKGKMQPSEIKQRLHERLLEVDRDYRDLGEFFDYVPIRIRSVPEGTFAEYLKDKEGTHPKVERIDMKEEEFRRFIQIVGRKTQLGNND